MMLLLRSAIPTLSLVTSLLLLNPERQIRHITVGCGEGGHRPVVDLRPDMIPYSHHLIVLIATWSKRLLLLLHIFYLFLKIPILHLLFNKPTL
jgi:hypothetical protein